MADSTAQFFDELGRRGHEPMLEKTSGTIRVDVKDGRTTERWLVTISKGDIAVSRQNGAADCVISADSALLDKIVSGKTNAVAAMLRGAITVEGNAPLLVSFQRLLPGPPRARRRRSRTTARSHA